MTPLLYLLTLAALAFGTGAYVFNGFLLPMAQELGISVGAAGQLQTVFVLSAALAGPPLAHALRQLDRKRLLQLSLGVITVSTALCTVLDSLSGLITARAVAGMAGGLVMPAATAAATTLASPGRRGTAISMVIGGMTLAFLLGIPVGSLVGGVFGWRGTFGFAAAIAAIAWLAISLWLPKIPAINPHAEGHADWRQIGPLVTVTLLAFAATMCLVAYIGPMLRVAAGIEGAAVAGYQVFIGIGAVLSLYAGATLTNRGAGKKTIAVLLLLIALAMLLNYVELLGGAPPGWPTAAVLKFATALNAFAMFSLAPIIQSHLINAARSAAPLALAVNGSANYLGQGLGTAIGGFVISHSSVVNNAPTAIAIALLGSVFTLLVVHLPGSSAQPDRH